MLLEKELQKLAEEKISVRLITINGYQMTGRIVDADASAVVIEAGTASMRKIVNTRAISTVEVVRG